MDIKRILLPEKVETDEKLYYRRSGGVTVEKDGVLNNIASLTVSAQVPAAS